MDIPYLIPDILYLELLHHVDVSTFMTLTKVNRRYFQLRQDPKIWSSFICRDFDLNIEGDRELYLFFRQVRKVTRPHQLRRVLEHLSHEETLRSLLGSILPSKLIGVASTQMTTIFDYQINPQIYLHICKFDGNVTIDLESFTKMEIIITQKCRIGPVSQFLNSLSSLIAPFDLVESSASLRQPMGWIRYPLVPVNIYGDAWYSQPEEEGRVVQPDDPVGEGLIILPDEF